MNRRNFIKAASCGALLTGALPSVSHAAAENRPPIPGSLGMLYDSTLCVGCQACVTKCQDINFPERNPRVFYGIVKNRGCNQLLVLCEGGHDQGRVKGMGDIGNISALPHRPFVGVCRKYCRLTNHTLTLHPELNL